MKSYEEVAKSVFEKSEKYFVQRWQRLRRIKIAVSTLSCVSLAAVIITAAVLGGNLSEYPAGTNGQPASNGEKNPTNDETTTASDTEALTTPPGSATDKNVVPIVPDVDVPDYVWQTPEEILADDSGVVSYGSVNIGTLLVYDGAVYTYLYTGDAKTDRCYAQTGDLAYFAEWFPCEVYAVKNEPDLIAIKFDFAIFEYRKQFDCNADIDGEKFEIAYKAYMYGDYDCGDIVLQTEDFTVYEAVRLRGESADTTEYVIDILPALKRELPDLFGADEYDGDAWWILVPDEAAEELTHNGSSLSTNIISDATPKDTDRILAAAQAAITETLVCVYVPAEKGSEIYSLVDGEVVWAGESVWGFGYDIYVNTADGRQQVLHSHLSEILVEEGDTVAKGQVIGLAGIVSRSTYGAGYKCFELFPWSLYR